MITLDEEMEFVERWPGLWVRVPRHDETKFNVRECKYGPGRVFKAHPHDTDQISYIKEGKIRVMVGDEERVVGAGGYYYTPAGAPHHIKEVLEPTIEILIGLAPPETNTGS